MSSKVIKQVQFVANNADFGAIFSLIKLVSFTADFFLHLMLDIPRNTYRVKGTDRLCKVVKVSMQCCGQIRLDSFETMYNY